MPAYPVDTIIKVAKISQYLASKDARSSKFYKNQPIDPRLHRLLYMERKALEWLYNTSPSDPTINGVANYVFSLCAPYYIEALTILGEGQSGNIVNPATGTVSAIVGYYIEFTVGQPGAPILDGESSFIIPLQGFVENSVSGDLNGSELSQYRNDQYSFTPDYSNPAQLTISFNEPVYDGAFFQFRGLRLQPIASPTASETYIEVPTYAAMLALATGPSFLSFLVINDENKGLTNTRYEWWPGEGIKEWLAANPEP